MAVLHTSLLLGLALAFAHNVYSMDFPLMDFARKTMLQYSSGTERTVQLSQPMLENRVDEDVDGRAPPRRGPVGSFGGGGGFSTDRFSRRGGGGGFSTGRSSRGGGGGGGSGGGGGFSIRRSSRRGGGGGLSTRRSSRRGGGLDLLWKGRGKYRPRPWNYKPKPKLTLVFINRTKTYRSRSKPSNKFLEALSAIERGVAEAKVARSQMRYSHQKLQAIKTTIQLAVRKRMYQFARHRLGQAIFIIKEHNSTRKSRSRRSTQNEASSFINDLRKTLGPAQFDRFMAVMGDVTLMFAIDTTGSMSDEIDTAKRIAVDVINYPRENPVNYILSPFNDPGTGPVIFKETTEGASFVKAINQLRATGGGDCPELTMKGILNALYEGPDPGSPLYVFTDASAKDATQESIEEVIRMAKFLGNVVINFFATEGCQADQMTGPFMKISDATDGQFLRLASNSELQNLNGFTGSVLGGSNIICSGTNFFQRKKRAAPTASRYSIKIDDSIDKISICISTDRINRGPTISLTDPQGVTITSGKISMSKVTIYEIKNPRVGNWTLVIPATAGQHTYFVKSNSDENIDFDHYFLMLIKKPASEVPVTDPLIGQKGKVIITIAGAEKIRNNTVVLELITKYGKRIRDIQVTPDSKGVRYVATFTPPARPFKLKIKGTTKKGNVFERISRGIVEPKHVQLRVLHSVNDFTLRRGNTSTVTFHLYNSASVNKRVRIKVKDRLGYARIESKMHIRTVKKGKWVFFSVLFTTPHSATVGTSDTAFVTVSVNNGREIVSQPVQLIVIA